jgi:hypothetical protein
MSYDATPTDTALIGSFERGELTGPVLEVAIIAILGDPCVPETFKARAQVMSSEPRLVQSNGRPLPCGLPITVALRNPLPGSPLLTALEIGEYVGSNTVVTLFEVSLIGDEAVACRGYAVF